MLGRIAIFENPNEELLKYLDNLHLHVLENVPIEKAEIGFEENAKEDD